MNYNTDLHRTSPKSSFTYGSIGIMKPRNIKKSALQNDEIIQKLESFQFPKAYSFRPKPVSTPDNKEEQIEEVIPISPTHISTEGFRRISCVSMINNSNNAPTRQRTRRFSHRRSEAVSGASSEDSIFSNMPATSKTLTCGTSIHSNNSATNLISKKLEFEELSISRKSPPITQQIAVMQPIIDLDVASKSLQPSLGSPIPIKEEAAEFRIPDQDSMSEEEQDSEEEESISVFDFLKESINESTQVVSENYNPFQYIHLNRSWWSDT